MGMTEEGYVTFDQEALTAAIKMIDPQTRLEQTAYRDGGSPGPATHVLRKDGREAFRGTEKQCDVFLFHACPHSWDHAKIEGWSIDPVSS